MPFTLPPPRIRLWDRLAAKREGAFAVFEVERVTLRAPGADPRDFFTLAFADWANVIAVTPQGEVVLVRQYRFGTHAFSLETPGGVIDDGESPVEAARRELLEETGYSAERFEPLCVLDPNPAMQGNLCHSFVAWNARPTAAPRFDAHEECEVLVVPREALPSLIDGGHMRHGLIVAAVERFLRHTAAPSSR